MNVKSLTLASALFLASFGSGLLSGERKAYADGSCDPDYACCANPSCDSCFWDTCYYNCGTHESGAVIACETPCWVCW